MVFRYQTLAAELTQKLRNHYWTAGAALPSLRQLALNQGVSLSTATKAYALLEQQGFIAAQAQKGFFVKAQFNEPSRRPKTEKLLKPKIVKKDNSDIILSILHNASRNDLTHLGGGFLPADFLPVKALQRCLHRASRRSPAAAYSYGHEQGHLGLRQAISERLNTRHCPVLPQQILITNGCLEAVNIALQIHTQAQDVVAIFTPCYSGLLLALQQTGRRILEVPCTASGPDLQALESLMQGKAFKALIFSAIAYNPLGFVLSVQVKQQLAALLQKYAIVGIEDDAFGELGFYGESTSPVFAYVAANSKTPMVYCSSVSKPLASGYRTGWLVMRGDITPYIKYKLNLNLTVALPVQAGLADYLFSEGYAAHITKLQFTLEQQLHAMASAVAAYFPEGTACRLPKGGLFLWVELPAGVDAMTLYELALKHKIMLCPGGIFSMLGSYKHCIRLTVGISENPIFQQALKQIGLLAKQLIPR